MQTPIRYYGRNLNIRKIKVNLETFYNYTLLAGLAVLLGSFCQIIFPIHRLTVGKFSILTGLPFLRNNFFFFPVSLSILALIWCVDTYFREKEIKEKMENCLIKYLRKINFAFIASNILSFGIFYFIYYTLYLPLMNDSGFKLSGHVLACIFSSYMLTNLKNICEMFRNQNIRRKMMTYVTNICTFLLYHNIYTIFWTCWIFHSVKESVFSYIFSFIFVIILHFIKIDRTLLILFQTNREKFDGKIAANRIFGK
jgi:hypothetical protein